MALFIAGDKFGVTAANRLVKAEGGGGTAAEGEVRLNDVSGTYTWQRYNGASWDDVDSLLGGNNDQYLRGDKNWKCAPINYTGEVVIDSNNPATLMVKVPTAVTSIKLKLVGGTFPTWNYTELGAHTHTLTVASSTHTHAIGDHTHYVEGTTGGTSATHTHSFSYSGETAGEAPVASGAGDHSHGLEISGNTGNQSADHTHTYGGYSNGTTGNTGTPSTTSSIPSTGISGYTLNDTAKTTITDAITLGFSTDNSTWTTKTKSDFASIANINNATGTDELNITTLLTLNSFNYIKISEPTAKKGGKILYHICIEG